MKEMWLGALPSSPDFHVGDCLISYFIYGYYLMGLPEILLYIILPVILIPFLIFGLKQEERLKEMVLFRLTIQERAYLTEFESEENYDKTAFWPEKGVREIDQSEEARRNALDAP
ncbi:PrgI family protein [Streptococcus equi]|uniref:PrgI family protein n=1 Tax=Streptococcus equi TaxID=1336 RepID=UPI001E5B045E|nr:PrgI family protein [Streptococcus equi]